MTILLIDDDEDDRKLFFEATREVDRTATCITAGDGEEGIAYLKDENNVLPDFIFLDLRMPGMSGQQFLKEIKKDCRLAPVPVIVYTTSRDEKESIELRKLGAVHFMSKPASPDEVYYLVSFVLSEQWN
jgi:DNA-binding response OmpR family regulator